MSADAEIDFRLGDGLDVLSPGEVDVIVIAGLGATTMRQMMENLRTVKFKT